MYLCGKSKKAVNLRTFSVDHDHTHSSPFALVLCDCAWCIIWTEFLKNLERRIASHGRHYESQESKESEERAVTAAKRIRITYETQMMLPRF